MKNSQKITEHVLVNAILNNSIDYAIAATDLDLRITYYNSLAEQYFGYTAAEVIGKTVMEMHTREHVDDERFAKAIEKVKRSGEYKYKLEQETENGTRYLESRITGMFDKQGTLFGYVLFSQDVTQKLKLTESLKETEENFRLIFENMSDVYYRTDNESKIIATSPAALKLYGYDHIDECIGKSVLDFYYDVNDNNAFMKELKKNGSVKNYPLKHKRKNGEPLFVEINAQIIFDNDGNVDSVVGVLRDITERRQAEEERIKLAAAIEQAAEVVVITDADGAIQYANPMFTSLTGYSREEVAGKNPRILKSGRHGQAFYHKMWETLNRGKVWKGHLINRKKDGTLFEEDVTISPVKNTRGEITNFVAVKRDITREMTLESQLRQAQKMESIGTLAGGIAHDFNNILTAILGYAELAKYDLPADSKANKKIDKIINAGERATDLVQQILDFSRKKPQKLQLLMPHLVVKELLKMISASLPATITIEKNIDPESGLIEADPTHIHQIVMNLVTNAFQSMENENGILSVSLSRQELDPEEAAGQAVSPGAFIVLSVSDTGCGMDKATMERIFEPYFTTKERGKGTGLGLAVIHGIVKRYQGFIRVESELGQGTSFQVYIPAKKKNIVRSNEKENKQPLPTGTERIMVIDDEDIILNLHEMLLVKLGYQVTTAIDSLDAMEQIRAHPDRFDVIVTDQTMPNLSGVELAREVLSLRPDMLIILCTGYSALVSADEALAMGIKKYVKKPVKPRELAKLVRKVLDEN